MDLRPARFDGGLAPLASSSPQLLKDGLSASFDSSSDLTWDVFDDVTDLHFHFFFEKVAWVFFFTQKKRRLFTKSLKSFKLSLLSQVCRLR